MNLSLNRNRTLCSILCLLAMGDVTRAMSLSDTSHHTRRNFVSTVTTIGITTSIPHVANAAMPMPLPSTEPRNVDVGGGFDLLRADSTKLPTDVLYPPSMEGLWVCSRIPTAVEGDLFQAQEVYKAMGGVGSLTLTSKGSTNSGNKPETYLTRFLKSNVDDLQRGVVNDRGFELQQRRKQQSLEGQVIWTVDQPNVLKYSINAANDKFMTLTVKSRTVELPSETTGGFGFNELICIEEDGGGLGNQKIVRAAQIKRRFRRSYDEQGNRVVEGLELIKTYRVLDGVAGTEFPTSTVKSQLRLVRPPSS